ncbi:MAG: hypothetical protein RI934_457 [Bacteroidota bacterium]
MMRSTIIAAALSLVLVQNTFAQQSAKNTDPDKIYKEALNLYDNRKFVAAHKLFEEVEKAIDQQKNEKDSKDISLLRINAEFYAAVCGLELFNDNAVNLLLHFVTHYPENPNAKLASFELGNFYYRQANYPAAIEWYNKTDPSNFSANQRLEYHFRNGYALFQEKKFDKAIVNLKRVKSNTSKYAYPATYYEGLAYYEIKKYKEALASLSKLKDSKTYAEVIPYTIVKINYDLPNYEEVLTYTAGILNTPKLKNEREILVLAASSANMTKKFELAINYYELARKKQALNDQESYELANAYFQSGKFAESIKTAEQIAERKNIFSQYALYLMGHSYIGINDKQAARNAFWKSGRLPFENNVKEEANFNYGKLSYELQFNQTAIETFQAFLKKYKKSAHVNEAASLLGEALLSTKNYKEAIVILEGLEEKSTASNLALQKVNFYRGIELINNGELKAAIDLLNKANVLNGDKGISANANYWKADCYYQLADYDNALKYFSLYSQTSAAAPDLANLVNYQLGYTYFKKEEYKSAVFYFDKFLKGIDRASVVDNKKINDATLRIADGYFVIKDYDKALFSYNKIANDHIGGTDYALFQKGIILGLQGKQNDKIITLKQVLNNYTKSAYADDATFEIANSYFSMNNNNDATLYFNNLIQLYPGSRYVAKARLSLGLIYYNEEKDELALSSYKAIITEYPGSEEAKEALLAIKNIYVDAGTGDEYLTYLKSLPFASVSANAQDSISYQSANTRYLKADYDNAIAGFNSYLTKFPEGIFSTEAHANRAECYLKLVKDDAALIDFNFIIDKNKTTYLERALLLAARINFRNKEYTKAAAQFKQLEEVAEYKENYAEAIGTAMRAYMNLNDTISTAAYANKIIAYEKSASDDINLAHLYLGKLYYKQNNRKAAAGEFEIVTKNTKTAVGAEAKYYLAQILFDEAQYLPAQQACFDLSNQVPSYEYWVAKGFILLADTYHKLGNDFQAKSTLQSIIDEYEGTDDIVTEAKSKLESFLISK